MTDLGRDETYLFQHVENKDPSEALFAKSHRQTGLPLDYDCTVLLREKLLRYMTSEDLLRVDRAFRFADVAHIGQFRSSGAPYITHPIAVTEICADWHLDSDAIMSALLHDVIEDQDVSKQNIQELFGDTVAGLVDGLTKLDQLHFKSKAERQAESFRKMLLAMSKDVRVILVKLADRLHNMRTLGAVSQEKKTRVARETIEVYVPIAHRLGLNLLVKELEDLCFNAMYPNRFQVIFKAMRTAQGHDRKLSEQIDRDLREGLASFGVNVTMIKREKSLYGIYRKMQEERKTFAQVMDIYGYRLVVDTVEDCYLTLGYLHRIYKPIPGRFKDFIALPKLNNYQSLHTTLVGPQGVPIELQIRTKQMHQVAEYGIAAHWIYDQTEHVTGHQSITSVGAKKVSEGEAVLTQDDDKKRTLELRKQTHRWMQSLLDIQTQTTDPTEFLEHVKVDLFPEEIYVLTPKGRIVALPRGATVVDFAYSIHTDIGHHAASAIVNGREVALNRVLGNGDTVEIICQETAIPSLDWLGFVRSGKSRAEIRSFLKKHNYTQSVYFGYKLLVRAIQDMGLQAPTQDDLVWQELLKVSDAKSVDELFVDIGLGRRLAAVVARQFVEDNRFMLDNATIMEQAKALEETSIFIQGNEGTSVVLATCCTPVPGDYLQALVRPGFGLVVHRNKCYQAKEQIKHDETRWIEVYWDKEPFSPFSAKLDVLMNNTQGALADLAAVVASEKSNIQHIYMSEQLTDQSKVSVRLTVQVQDVQHLWQLIRAMLRVETISQVKRYKGG